MTEAFCERRREQRRRTLLRGSVVHGGGRSTMDCVVRDMTATGARLRFAGPVLLPSIFELQLVERGDRRRARRVWMRDLDMGIAFE